MTTADPIQRSEERIRSTGEIFTPLELVDEILDKLPQELFQDPTKTFLDPAAGDGNFLVRVVERKYKMMWRKGAPKTKVARMYQALATTFGIDLMPDNVGACRDRLVKKALELVDPPKGHWVEFIEGAVEIVDANIIQGNTLDLIFDGWPPTNPKDLVD